MKLLITSDIHGNKDKLIKLLNKHKDITHHFDAGDSQLNDDILIKYNIISVRGNTDYNNDLPLERIININDKKILIDHGHTLNVKLTYTRLFERAKFKQVDICIFGHTHINYINKIDNILFLNPGSLGYDNTYIIYKNNEARIYKLYE